MLICANDLQGKVRQGCSPHLRDGHKLVVSRPVARSTYQEGTGSQGCLGVTVYCGPTSQGEVPRPACHAFLMGTIPPPALGRGSERREPIRPEVRESGSSSRSSFGTNCPTDDNPRL